MTGPLALQMTDAVREAASYPGWRIPLVPIERRNVNDYTHRHDDLTALVVAYFNTNIADGPGMMITEKEAAALVDLVVSEL